MRLKQVWLFSGLSLFTFGLGLAWFAFQPPVEAQSFDRRAMLESLVINTIVPLHEDFLAETESLNTVAQAFQADPTEETLSAFQGGWHSTSTAFERVQIYRFQRLMPYLTQIDSSPANIPFIEGYMDVEEIGTIDAEFAEFLGSSSKGLPTLEYLIFADDALAQLTANQNRLDYSAALAAVLNRVAAILLDEWTLGNEGYGDRFVNADDAGDDVRSSLSMLTNEMIAELEDVAQFWLGEPLGYRTGGEPQPDLVEAPYSQASVDKLIANLEGFQMAFNGMKPDETLSLADYLDFLGATFEGEPLAEVINAQVEIAITTLQAIDAPLQTAVLEETELVETAYIEARTLLRLVKTDMANQLGVTVTFSDNDGD